MQYRILKRGDICRHRDIIIDESFKGCGCELCGDQRRVNWIKTYSVAKVNGAQGNFTVASYSGPDARKVIFMSLGVSKR